MVLNQNNKVYTIFPNSLKLKMYFLPMEMSFLLEKILQLSLDAILKTKLVFIILPQFSFSFLFTFSCKKTVKNIFLLAFGVCRTQMLATTFNIAQQPSPFIADSSSQPLLRGTQMPLRQYMSRKAVKGKSSLGRLSSLMFPFLEQDH